MVFGRKSSDRPTVDIITGRKLDPRYNIDKDSIFKPQLSPYQDKKYSTLQNARVKPGRAFLISEFQHKLDGPKFHHEYAAGMSSNPTQYSKQMGQFQHHASVLPETKNVIRTYNFSPVKPWL